MLYQTEAPAPAAAAPEGGQPQPSAAAAETPAVAKAIAHRDQQTGAAEKNIADLLHRGGLANRILEGDTFHSRVENPPHLPLVLERHHDQLYLTHYQLQNDEMVLDAELVFKVGANGQLKLTETARQDPIQGGELRTRSPEFALTFSQTLLRQGFADAIALVMRSSEQSPQQPEPEVSEPQELESSKPQVSEPQEPYTAEPQVSESQEPNRKEQAEAIQPEVAPASPPHNSSTVTPEQVESWSRIAQALAKPDDYQARVEQVTAAYRAGEPLSSNAEAALHQALSQFQSTLNSVKDWYRLSRDAGAPEHYLEKIQNVGVNLQNGQPMSENARSAMQTDFRRADWVKLNQGVSESTPERHTARVALRALQQGKRPEEVLKILEFDPSYRQLHAQQGQASAQAYAQNAIVFAMKYHQAPQPAVSQRSPHMSHGHGMVR